MRLVTRNKKLIRRWDSERELFHDGIFNHFYALRPGSYRIRWNNEKLEMWANAQRDGRPAEYRWRPLFNAAKFGWRPLLDAVQ